MSPQEAMRARDEIGVAYVIEDVLLSAGATMPGPMDVLSFDDEWLEVRVNDKKRMIAWAHIVHLTIRNA